MKSTRILSKKLPTPRNLLEPGVVKADEKDRPHLPSQPGSYEVRIEINEDKKIPESNYGNNTHTFKYTVR